MFAFSLAVGFADQAPNERRARQMMDAFPASPPEAPVFSASAHAAAGLARWSVVRRDAAASPHRDTANGALFVGDVRIYNRPELISELALPSSGAERSDLELARLAYGKWGHDCPRHLVGDFAFAAWDDRTRTLFAARDQLGIRPLYYLELPDGLAVATHVEQLLALLERPVDRVDTHQILDWLSGEITDIRRTFFRGIHRLGPGNFLRAAPAGAQTGRYWLPRLAPNPPASYEDNCRQAREIFERAVRDRLESDHPLVAHSSGGFDSSTIVMVADRIYRAEPGRQPLVLASAIPRGFPSDESQYIDAVAREVTFDGIRWNPVDDPPASFPGVARSEPLLKEGLAGGPLRDVQLAQERGARVLLSGMLGDDVWHATGVLRDFVRAGRLVGVATSLRRIPSARTALRRALDSSLGILPPAIALRAGRRLFTHPFPPPAWLGPVLRQIFPPSPAQLDLPDVAWPSHLLCGLWAQLTHPHRSAVVDAFVEHGTRAGLEIRVPHADLRLVEFVFGIPWQQRLPAGHLRRTGRDALGPLLPAEFSRRTAQRPWTEVVAATAHATVKTMTRFMEAGPALSEPFVDRGIARAMFRDMLENGTMAAADSQRWALSFGALEAWLRELLG